MAELLSLLITGGALLLILLWAYSGPPCPVCRSSNVLRYRLPNAGVMCHRCCRCHFYWRSK